MMWMLLVIAQGDTFATANSFTSSMRVTDSDEGPTIVTSGVPAEEDFTTCTLV